MSNESKLLLEFYLDCNALAATTEIHSSTTAAAAAAAAATAADSLISDRQRLHN